MLIYEKNLHKKIGAISQLGAEKITIPSKLDRQTDIRTDISNYRVALLLIRCYIETIVQASMLKHYLFFYFFYLLFSMFFLYYCFLFCFVIICSLDSLALNGRSRVGNRWGWAGADVNVCGTIFNPNLN